MSRRKAFDTGLSGSAPKPTPASTSSTSQSKPPKHSAPHHTLPPRVTPPNPEHPTASVPTETTEEKENEQSSSGGPATPPEDVDEDVCIICAEPVTYWSVGVCGHRTCHICAVRLRTFYKKYECTFCKTVTPSLLFSRQPDTPFPSEHHITPSPPQQIAAAQAGAEKLEKGKIWYEGLTLPGTLDVARFPYADKKLGVVFEDEDLMEATLLLLRFNCPAPDCAHMAVDWTSLEKHTLSNHGGAICRVCRSQLSRFAHEQVLYPPGLLGLHDPSRVPRGQRPPRPRGEKEIEMVKSWDAPHPMCEFCHTAFFGPDELFAHMRKAHEECFVCKQSGERDVYFQNYDKLEEHFRSDHYPCLQPTCLERKFVVFPNEMDLRAHTVTEHGDNMSSRDRAQARQLQIDFTSTSDNRRGGPSRQDRQERSGRGFQMARPPQGQQISQALPMTPDQAAQQRRQLQTDRQEESRRKRAFNTELTDSQREQAVLAGGEPEGRRSGFATPREDVDEPTAIRHAALLSRVALLVNESSVKLQSFRSAVRQYRSNESGAKDMVDTIFHVLDRDVDATTGVVREIASLFGGDGEGEKETAVLEALNGFRVEQREQFPALADAPRGLGTEWAGITSGKILNAKRATHTSGRIGSRAVWDRVEAAAASSSGGPSARAPRATTGLNGRYVPGASGVASSGAFPALSGPPPSAATKSGTHSTPWSTGGSGSTSKTPSALAGPIIKSVNYPTGPSKAKPLNNQAFPSLPPSSNKGISKAERQALFTKPTPREESIRRITGQGNAAPPATNGWGGGGGGDRDLSSGVETLSLNGANGDGQEMQVGGQGGGSGGGKKKGKQKQLLFTVSARPS